MNENSSEKNKNHGRAGLRIGIDIGGTHSDGALVDGLRLVAAAKVRTQHEDLLASIRALLSRLLNGRDASRVECVNLSTTLTTNALITGQIAPVAVLVTAGPGIAPDNFCIGPEFHVIGGSLNHVGMETAPVDEEELTAALADCERAGIRHFAVAGKFSPRNPAHELALAGTLREKARVVCCGHQLSGSLNFGRRINTTYFNAAVYERVRDFAAALQTSLQEFGLAHAQVNILKADGGTLPLARALDAPVQSIFSGPAASVMGILATLPQDEDVALLDIGGTTTDMAVLAGGEPLLEREGIALSGKPTLVRALRVQSIGIGGDSAIHAEPGAVRVGPDRLSPCMAAGGNAPTLMDACNFLKKAQFGDIAASQKGIADLAASCGMEAETLAETALAHATAAIHSALTALVREVNSKPLYTIHEMLTERELLPKKLILIGGPAEVFRPLLQEKAGLPALCPALSGVTNAIGAALSRSTAMLDMHANTAKRLLLVPTLGLNRQIARNFSLEDAVSAARELLAEDMTASGAPVSAEDIQITQADTFNMVEGYYTTGQNIRVRAQVRPAVLGLAEISGDTDTDTKNEMEVLA